ncbi:bile acid:sodium symporter [Brumimicrobium aurantiacum]|uniref:Bile acid:sodium symporter n=1 Tax=Brumimicrobium aurantiacum TaxID=1737063 RepID=A0A3E1F295_9FLAO|nr:bile acid:sodium symporter [Brumimicrobium aurantiacum]RFC55893.1 bile acid:sodium symporter [Brumimicrobium aurantiacum]
MKIDPFVIAIALSITLAYFFPQLGLGESPVPLDTIASIGISLIFFFYGLKLSSEAIKSGLKNWKLHIVVQASTFLLFPLLVVVFYPFVKGTSHEMLWLSILFMAALPSTVSSSVVMVSLAKGNVSAAIFNASISGLIGIAITPLWMSSFIQETSIEYDFTAIYMQLIIEILMPLILGLLLRRFLGELARKNSRKLSLFDKSIILIIIYKSFVHSFEEKVFSELKFIDLILLFVLVVSIFFFVYFIIGWIVQKLNFNREDQITAQFCGTKKSLVHGTVFSEALFGQTNIMGLMLLPLMLFHAFQILIISIFATRKGANVE